MHIESGNTGKSQARLIALAACLTYQTNTNQESLVEPIPPSISSHLPRKDKLSDALSRAAHLPSHTQDALLKVPQHSRQLPDLLIRQAPLPILTPFTASIPIQKPPAIALRLLQKQLLRLLGSARLDASEMRLDGRHGAGVVIQGGGHGGCTGGEVRDEILRGRVVVGAERRGRRSAREIGGGGGAGGMVVVLGGKHEVVDSAEGEACVGGVAGGDFSDLGDGEGIVFESGVEGAQSVGEQLGVVRQVGQGLGVVGHEGGDLLGVLLLGEDELIEGGDLGLERFVEVREAGGGTEIGQVDLDAGDGLAGRVGGRCGGLGLGVGVEDVEGGGGGVVRGLLVRLAAVDGGIRGYARTLG